MHDARVALLNAAYKATATRQNFHRDIDAELVEYDVTAGEFPEWTDFDACVLTGSSASVYWEDQWIADLASWVEQAIDDGTPVLGICFGHQLLADVLVGAVEDMGEYEIGYRSIERVGDTPLFDGIRREFTAFTTHSDHVVRLPPGAELLAENDYGVHGFRKGDVYGLQFHPEYDQAMAERVTRSKDGLAASTRREVLAGITDENYTASLEAKRVFDNFLSATVLQNDANPTRRLV